MPPLTEEDLPRIVSMRCAACGLGFSVPVLDLQVALQEMQRRHRPPAGFFAILCSDCGSGGKSSHDGVVVRLGRADRPLFGGDSPAVGTLPAAEITLTTKEERP